MLHAPADIHTYKKFAFDHFDSVLCFSRFQIENLRQLKADRGSRRKQLFETVCTYYDFSEAKEPGEEACGAAAYLAEATAGCRVKRIFEFSVNPKSEEVEALFLGRFLEVNAATTAENCHHPAGPEFVGEKIQQICRLLGAETPAEARERIDGFAREAGPTFETQQHFSFPGP